MRRVAAAALVATAMAACGDAGDGGTTTERNESPSPAPTVEPTPSAEPTPPTATAPSAPPPPADATGPEERPGGAGDEEAARTRVRLVLDERGFTPRRVEVPAFIALRVTVRNDLARRVTVTLRGGGLRKVDVRGRSTRGFNVGGLGRAEYPLAAGDAARATLVAG